MAVPRIAHMAARLRARFHVQVRLEARPGADIRTPATVAVSGRVVRVFRGEPALRVGDEVRFSVHLYRKGDELWPGAARFTLCDDFMRMTHVEAYLNGDPPDCEVPLDAWVAVDGPTREATIRTSRWTYLVALIKWHFPRL
jgi:hypothetical protein